MFRDFCSQTSLHGWYYVGNEKLTLPMKLFWLSVIIGSIVASLVLMRYGYVDFQAGAVKVEIADRATDLTQVNFPSVVVCNINTVRKSFLYFLKEIAEKINLNVTVKDLWNIVKEFISGKEGNITEAQHDITEAQHDIQSILSSKPFLQMFRKLILESKNDTKTIGNIHKVFRRHQLAGLFEKYGSYESQNASFKDILHRNFFLELASQWEQGQAIFDLRWNGNDSHDPSNETGMYHLRGFGTDYGHCNWMTPFVWMPKKGEEFNLDKLKPGASAGENNGLILMVDAESYDYWVEELGVGQRQGVGFKVALQYHLDMPVMGQDGVNIIPGTSVQIAVTPTLTTTTEKAKARFTPEERKCYFDDEIKLEHLPYPPEALYRYGMSNCLFEAVIQRIKNDCGCYPNFHKFSTNMCQGKNMICLNKIMQRLGMFRKVNDTGEEKQCFSACKDVTYASQVTSSLYPSAETFTYLPQFCQLVFKLNKTCQDTSRKKSLEEKYSHICVRIEEVMFGKSCSQPIWKPDEAFGGAKKKRKSFENLIVQYAKENIAIINVFIRQPYVQKIVVDERIGYMTYVSNVGGILGLCMGCSLVTGIEVLWHIFNAAWNKKSILCKNSNKCCYAKSVSPINVKE